MSRSIVREVDYETVIVSGLPARGAPGQSAYQAAVASGYTGTEAEFGTAYAAYGTRADEVETLIDSAFEAFGVPLATSVLQVIGTDPVANTGGEASPFPWIHAETVVEAGFVTQIKAAFASTGTLKVGPGTLGSGTFVGKNVSVSLPFVAGINTWNAPGDFTAFAVAPGDVIIFKGPMMFSAGGPAMYYNSFGLTDAETFDTTPNNTEVYGGTFQMQVSVSGEPEYAYIKTVSLSQAAYNALATKDPYTLYVVI